MEFFIRLSQHHLRRILNRFLVIIRCTDVIQDEDSRCMQGTNDLRNAIISIFVDHVTCMYEVFVINVHTSKTNFVLGKVDLRLSLN